MKFFNMIPKFNLAFLGDEKVHKKNTKKSNILTMFYTLLNERARPGVRGRLKKGLDSIKKLNRIPRNTKKALIGAVLVILLIVLFSRAFSTSDPNKSNNSNRVSVKAAKSSAEINKVFDFPLKDKNGELVSEIEYEIVKAELMDEIIVKGQKATAVEGRTFLILTLKIKNDLTQSVEMNTKDYVRLALNGNEDEWLAPEIHNDPVKVQAESTKSTRLGFPINDSDTDYLLRVGEIDGEKEMVPLNLN